MEVIIISAINELFSIDTEPVFTRPDPKFGDYATNIALQIAKKVGKTPREVADLIAEKLQETGVFTQVSIAGPGWTMML